LTRSVVKWACHHVIMSSCHHQSISGKNIHPASPPHHHPYPRHPPHHPHLGGIMFKSYIGQGSSAARSWASHNSHVAVLRHDSPEIRRDVEPRSDNDEPCCIISHHTICSPPYSESEAREESRSHNSIWRRSDDRDVIAACRRRGRMVDGG
jgi:hypothetical protein